MVEKHKPHVLANIKEMQYKNNLVICEQVKLKDCHKMLESTTTTFV